MTKKLYPRLAWQNLRKNARFYLPYILTIIGTSASFYIMLALAGDTGLPTTTRYSYLQTYVGMGAFIIAIFTVIFLFYTNSFLMKQRRRELGLYNVLGMGKRHIALLLMWESIYTALIGIPCGIAVGALFQSAFTALALRLMRFDIYYSSRLSLPGILFTFLFFSAVLAACLIKNIISQSRKSPVELIREGNTGEKEPRTRIFLTILGILTLGGGYAIAISVKVATQALALYFLAVLLVIIGTYCLFTSVSIAILKLLRKNKKFYYSTDHFIGVSGMLYRMKRNAVGLANICILSTMVLVAVSGTLSLFLGTEDIINSRYPKDINMTVVYDPNLENKLNKENFVKALGDTCNSIDINIDGEMLYDEYIDTDGFVTSDGINLGIGENVRSTVIIMTAENYAKRTSSEKIELKPDEIMLYCHNFSIPGDTFTLNSCVSTENGTVCVDRCTYKISHRIYKDISGYEMSVSNSASCIIVVADDNELYKLSALDLKAYALNPHTRWIVSFNTDGTDEQNISFDGYFDNFLSNKEYNIGSWDYFTEESRVQYSRDMYENNGGFFFLGVFLGLLFMMAAALIIYYKQITEGFEDCTRYRIMRQVGLDRREVRRSVNSQVLVVFFAPLAVAVMHIAFDFPLVRLLLTLFGLTNTGLTLLCTLGTLVGFGLIYAVVFILTAKAYNRIVN